MTTQLCERQSSARVPAAPRRAASPAAGGSTAQRLEDRANAGPHARDLSAIRGMLNARPAASAGAAAAPVQAMRANAPGPRPPMAGTQGVVQRKVQVGTYDNGAVIGPDGDSEEAQDFLAELKEEDFDRESRDQVRDAIEEATLYTFRDIDHLWDWLSDPDADPPDIEEPMEMEDADVVNDIAEKFGTTFKGRNVPFSGSRVYAVAHSQGSDELWAMLNSATGYIPKAKQDVVKKWKIDSDLPITFPRNTKASIEHAGLKRPTVLTPNAHAEVNELVQHACYALESHNSPHDVGITMASDIAHCVECYWAGNAMMQKGTGTFESGTGCENKLFARWREPWVGFYKDYGENPFRNKDGTLKKGLGVGAYDKSELNKRLPPKLKGLYE